MAASEREGDDLDNVPPFNWEKLLRWLLVAGLGLWVVAGAVEAVILAYFVDAGLFYTGSEAAGRLAVTTYQISTTAEAIAYKVWVASGVLLAFLWIRSRVDQSTTR